MWNVRITLKRTDKESKVEEVSADVGMGKTASSSSSMLESPT